MARFLTKLLAGGRSLALCGTLFVLLTGLAAHGEQYPFLPVTGSPRAVAALFQDSRGRLWVAGEYLACFDGARFFDMREYGFPSVDVHSFAEDPQGGIWIGTHRGLFRFAAGRMEQIAGNIEAFTVFAPQADLAIFAGAPSAPGDPAAISLMRVRRDGGGWKAESILDLGRPESLTLDPAGVFLYPASTSEWEEFRLQDVISWRAGQPRLGVTRRGRPGVGINGKWAYLRDHFGCVWHTSPGTAMVSCAGGDWQPAPFRGALGYAEVHEASDGQMLIWSNSLLSLGRPGSFRTLAHANGLPAVKAAWPAKDGTIWLGTAEGLYRFPSPFQIEYWTSREGVPTPPWSVARVGDRIFAGLDRRIVALSRDRVRWETVAEFEKGGTVSALLPTKDGTLLAAFIAGGVVEVTAKGKVVARTSTHKGPQESLRLATANQGEMWTAGDQFGQLSRAGPLLKFAVQPLREKPPRNILTIKYEAHTHTLWSCYDGGLIMRDAGGHWHEFDKRDGLLTNGCWGLAPLPNGDVWYAYYNFPGLALIRPGVDGHIRVRQYERGTIPEAGGVSLDADTAGRVWRGGDLGAYVATGAQAESANWLPLDRSDGFPANGMNSGSVLADADGSLWWGADNDLAHYIPPSDLTAPAFAPQVFLSAFSWQNQPPKLAEAISQLPHGVSITAHVGSLQFDRRNALKVRYRLLPDQSSWQESSRLDIPLGLLSYGTHTLEVQGRLFTGPWSQTLGRSFAVPRPPWLTWPFETAYVLAATVLAWFAYFFYRRYREAEAQMLPDLATWRTAALLPDAHQLTGTLLDSRFEVGQLLARGGFANVMDGFDRSQGRRCAIKVFRNEITNKDWLQRSFDQEVAALQKVSHPGVVSIYAYGRTPLGAPYLVMEFIEGENLREIIAQGALPPGRAGRLLQQLAAALDSIHALQICHRDLKPENVIVRNPGMPETEAAVLIDFSIAIIKDADETLHGLSRAAGTFDYMAPEQAVGFAQPSSDVYSLARVLIEMLTGQPLRILLPGAALDLPDRVAALRLPLSEDSLKVLAAALAFDPSQRPSSVSQFAEPLVRDLRATSGEAASA